MRVLDGQSGSQLVGRALAEAKLAACPKISLAPLTTAWIFDRPVLDERRRPGAHQLSFIASCRNPARSGPLWNRGVAARIRHEQA